MTFLELYGIELDRELGSADRTQRFTTLRRKAALNAAQLEWVKRTECLIKETTVTLTDDTQEVDLETTITDFAWLAKQGISIKIVKSTTTRYIEGDDLIVTTIERLNTEEPGWRAESKSNPRKVFIRRNGGALNLGLHPKPSVGAGETWTAIVPYVLIPADMSADADEPFTVSSNIVKSLRPWHRALVYYAAFDLEKLRKDAAREQAMFQLFQTEVDRFLGNEKPANGRTVRMVKRYRDPRMNLYPRRWDPRT